MQIEGFTHGKRGLFGTEFQWARLQYLAMDRLRQKQEAALQDIRSPEDLATYGEKVRAHVLKWIGGLLDAPLATEYTIVREISFDDIDVHVIRLESLPGFIVPGTIYHPRGNRTGSGVFIASGHISDSKSTDDYQRLALELAQNGITVLVIDWMGLGERKAWLNPDGTVFKSGSFEHNYMGIPCHLAGYNLLRYMLHDSFCGINILRRLEGIDSNRIGVTGHSGGGIMTTYISMFDENIAAAAPVCSICDRYRHEVNTRGNDAESMVFGLMEAGISTVDVLAGHVPRPVYIGGSDSDIFPVDGVMLEVERLRHLFEVAGAPDRLSYHIAPGRHAYLEELRHEAVRFFSGYLDEVSGEGLNNLRLRSDNEIPLLTQADLAVSKSGLLYRDMPEVPLPNEINRKEFEKLERRSVDRQNYAETLQAILGFDMDAAESIPLYPSRIAEKMTDDYEIRYMVINTVPELELGGIALAPQTDQRDAWLYLRDNGSNAITSESEEAGTRARAGDLVLFADLRGIGGVVASPVNPFDRYERYGTEHWFASTSVMMGTSVAAQRTHDVIRWIRYLREIGFGADRIRVSARGQAGLYALLAFVLAGKPAEFVWENPIADWIDVIHNRDYDYATFNERVAVFGIARCFSMRDLLDYIRED